LAEQSELELILELLELLLHKVLMLLVLFGFVILLHLLEEQGLIEKRVLKQELLVALEVLE
jgi:hypothetical protein